MLFSSDIIAPNNADTLSALKSKHPSPSVGLHFPDAPASDQRIVSSDTVEIMNCISSFKSGSAGGLDGLTPQHVKDLVSNAVGDAGRSLLSNLTALINLMLAGKVPLEITDVLYGANLCALSKKDGGIRPIAIGSTIRRIASKVCCRRILPTVSQIFQPIQLGFGSKGGCEAAVHAARTFLLQNGGEVLLKVDVKNAFNSVDRAALLTQVQNKIPEIYPYVFQCYGQPSKLLYNEHPICSAVGCQQGDPLGPAIFSLAIHQIICTLNSKFNVWYLDDGTLGGTADSVCDDFQILINEFRKIGLEFNFSKCEIFVSDSVSEARKNLIINKFSTLAPNIKVLSKESLYLLGAPVLDEAIPKFVDEKIKKFNDSSDRIYKINSHLAFFIMRFCLFVPKFTYFLRCSQLFKFKSHLITLDDLIRSSLTKILNCPFEEDRVWTQATLPICLGGLGVRKISDLALPAFLSSVHSTEILSRSIIVSALGTVEVSYLSEARNAWLLACPGSDPPILANSQRQWDKPLCNSIWQTLLSSSTNDLDRARLLAVSAKESGHWLQAIPSSHIGTLLTNTTLSLAICLRVGARTNLPHRCRCGEHVDKYGHHGLSCSRSAGRMSRHAALNDIIRRGLVTAGVPAVLEPVGITRDDGKRPDGITLIPWQHGKPLVWDATCVDTLAASHTPATCRAAGRAAAAASDAKRRKYAVLGSSYIFAPFAVETMGPWSHETHGLVKEISSKLIEVSGDRRAGSFFCQRISLAIQRGNAASLLGTLPSQCGDNLEEVFYLV